MTTPLDFSHRDHHRDDEPETTVADIIIAAVLLCAVAIGLTVWVVT